MLIAARDLNCFGKLVHAGQPIPTPEKWDPVVLDSNINLGWVKDVSESEAKRLDIQMAPRANPKPEGLKAVREINEKTSELRCCGRDFKNKRALSVHARSHR